MTEISRLLPEDLQQLLISHHYDLGSYGADGIWGSKTSAAIEEWFHRGEDLLLDAPSPATGLVPSSWLPDCKMTRIVAHWTAGAYSVSDVDREHYHIIVGGDLKLVRGDNSIKANVSTSDSDGYAGHTKNCNSGSIGIAVACMANADDSPFDAGNYPMTKGQWLVMAEVAAECCRKYGIKVTPTTVLQHGEVQKNLGVAQNGKWDCCKLPWMPQATSVQACDAWRNEVAVRL